MKNKNDEILGVNVLRDPLKNKVGQTLREDEYLILRESGFNLCCIGTGDIETSGFATLGNADRTSPAAAMSCSSSIKGYILGKIHLSSDATSKWVESVTVLIGLNV